MPDVPEVKPHGAEPENETPQPVIPIDDEHRSDLDEAAHQASQ